MNFPAGPSTVHLRTVRMGEMAVTKAPNDVLSVVGLGSCVAMILIAPEKRAAALAHVVLPERRMTGGREAPPAKFADTALPAILGAFRSLRVREEDLYAVVVGGAKMFGHSAKSKLAAVGDRNVEATITAIEAAGIPIIGRDIGGESGRSVQVLTGEGRVLVKSGMDEPINIGRQPSASAPRVSARTRQATETFPADILHSIPEGRMTA
ncbi:MAG: chemotaxis protein CheD [Solirubrobacterales bacterium]